MSNLDRFKILCDIYDAIIKPTVLRLGHRRSQGDKMTMCNPGHTSSPFPTEVTTVAYYKNAYSGNKQLEAHLWRASSLENSKLKTSAKLLNRGSHLISGR